MIHLGKRERNNCGVVRCCFSEMHKELSRKKDRKKRKRKGDSEDGESEDEDMDLSDEEVSFASEQNCF